jgi:CRP/FNR family transcriptional regulator, anaerobic regulatory protein
MTQSLLPAPRIGHKTAAATAPLILAAPFGRSDADRPVPLLSAVEARRLMEIATTVHFPKGALLYEEGERAEYVYNLIEGEVKTFSLLSSGRYRVLAFLRAGDLVGLAENGGYISSAQAITPLIAHRLPVKSLEQLLRRDPDLPHHFLCKLCHDLRLAQFHTTVLSRHDADGKIAMFLRERGFSITAAPPAASTFVPMTRSDIAAYLGLSLETVSRSFRHLERKGIIKLRGLHHVDILDPTRLEAIAFGM